MMDPTNQQGQPADAAQGVYVGGTYPATLTRAAQGTPSYRPPQFAFTTPPVRPLQEEFKSTKSHEEGDGSSTESVKPLPTPRRCSKEYVLGLFSGTIHQVLQQRSREVTRRSIQW
jgi:hypothetical protein